MAKSPNSDLSLLFFGISASMLSFTVRTYSDFLAGLLLGGGLATLAVFAYRRLTGRKKQ